MIVSRARAEATYATETSETDESTLSHVDYSELGKRLTSRLAELGNPVMPRNAGNHRTDSKRALLKAFKEAGGKW
jgi:hypothetical protein